MCIYYINFQKKRKNLNLIKLLLAPSNFLLDVVVHQVCDVPHQQTHVRQLQGQRLKVHRQGQVLFQVVFLKKTDTDADFAALLQGLDQSSSGSVKAESELTNLVLEQ